MDTTEPQNYREELVAIFKAAWHEADELGLVGGRTEAGIDAVLGSIQERLR
jgi:hypothetical protein